MIRKAEKNKISLILLVCLGSLLCACGSTVAPAGDPDVKPESAADAPKDEPVTAAGASAEKADAATEPSNGDAADNTEEQMPAEEENADPQKEAFPIAIDENDLRIFGRNINDLLNMDKSSFETVLADNGMEIKEGKYRLDTKDDMWDENFEYCEINNGTADDRTLYGITYGISAGNGDHGTATLRVFNDGEVYLELNAINAALADLDFGDKVTGVPGCTTYDEMYEYLHCDEFKENAEQDALNESAYNLGNIKMVFNDYGTVKDITVNVFEGIESFDRAVDSYTLHQLYYGFDKDGNLFTIGQTIERR